MDNLFIFSTVVFLVGCCVVHACHFYRNHETRNDIMDFRREKRRKSVHQASMLENEVKRDGGGKIKRHAKENGMTSLNRGLVERDDVSESLCVINSRMVSMSWR